MNDKKIKVSSVYGVCLKHKNKYYDTDMALADANIHGGFTVRVNDKNRGAGDEIHK